MASKCTAQCTLQGVFHDGCAHLGETNLRTFLPTPRSCSFSCISITNDKTSPVCPRVWSGSSVTGAAVHMVLRLFRRCQAPTTGNSSRCLADSGLLCVQKDSSYAHRHTESLAALRHTLIWTLFLFQQSGPITSHEFGVRPGASQSAFSGSATCLDPAASGPFTWGYVLKIATCILDAVLLVQ